jgi:hypothetical protein
MDQSFIGIDFDEGDQSSYRAVTAKIGLKGKEHRFETGDPIKDWKQAILFCADNASLVLFSSSVDHFVMDGEDYKFIEVEGVDLLVRNV